MIDETCKSCGVSLPEPDLRVDADVNPAQFLGWLYGYPQCCVDWFVCRMAAYITTGGNLPESAKNPPKHPESGHTLCLDCEAGEFAPMRDRIADSVLAAIPDGEGGWLLNGRGIEANVCADCCSYFRITRTCSVCGKTKNLNEFSRDSSKALGRDYRCRGCDKKRKRKERAAVRRADPFYIEKGFKKLRRYFLRKCAGPCKRTLPLTEFARNRSDEFGRAWLCREFCCDVARRYAEHALAKAA